MPAYVDKNFGNHSRKVLSKLRSYREAEIYNMMVRGATQQTIAKELQISQAAVSMTISNIRAKAKAQLQAYLTEHLPLAHAISLSGLDQVISELWSCYLDRNAELRTADKAALLNLLAHCYGQRLAMCGDGELVSEAMNQMELVKRQLAGMLSPEQAALMQSRIASFQTGGVVTKAGEVQQEKALREQQRLLEQEQQKQPQEAEDTATSLNNKSEIESSREEDLDDESSLRGNKSSASSSFKTTTAHLRQNNERLSLADCSSSDTTTSNFEHGGGNGNASAATTNDNNPKPPARSTRNKVF